MRPLLDQALDLAMTGIPVFPCDGAKRPTTENGFHAASTDPGIVARLFADPRAQVIGVPTGAASGFDALDIDPDGMDWLRANAPGLGTTRVHRTRRNGFHRLYRHREGMACSAGKIAKGVDVRADGGFIVWWPAAGLEVVRDGPMADWPDALAEQIMVRQIGTTEHRAPRNPEDLAPPSAAAMVDLIRAMPNPADCEHSDWVAVNLAVQGAIRGGLATGVLDDEQADAIKDEMATWSARWEGPNPGDYEAERNKWDNDWSRRDNDVSGWRNLVGWAGRFGADVGGHLLALVVADFATVPLPPDEPATPPRPTRIRLLTPSECEAQPGRAYVIKGVLAEGDLACIFGPPGAGKSIAGPHIGYAVAQGRTAFGMRTKPGEVFYVAAEDTHGMRQRTRALKLVNGDAPGFLLVDGVSNLLDDAQLAELVRLVRARRPKLVFLDTIAMGFPGIDENGSADMGRVVAVGRTLAGAGAAVVLIHHDTKAGSGTPRGHSILNGALDMAVHLTRDDATGIVSGRLTKNRNGACDRTIAFHIKPERIGVDEDGDVITAPTAHELTADALRSQAVNLTPTARAAYAILQGLPPDDTGRVPEADWRDACDDQRISASDDPKSRDRTFRRAFQELRDRKLLAVGDGHVSIAGPAVGDFPLADLATVEKAPRTGPNAADERAAKSTQVTTATKSAKAVSRTARTKRGPNPAKPPTQKT